MILAGMIRTDETALICDMAETYGIYDWRALPLETAAALASGLREDSRIKRKIAGMPVDTMTLLTAMIVDRLSLLVWSKTTDAEKGENRPGSIVEKILSLDKKEENEVEGFQTPEDFQDAWRAAVEEK